MRFFTQVVVVTHAYPPRNGVRWLPNGVKVYYIPVQPLPPTHVHATLPNFFTALPHLRSIFVRESIDIVHAHASLSALGMEAIMHARAMGIRAVFTDHSLFGLGNMAEIWGNKMLKGCLSDVEAVICVSHTGSVPAPSTRALSLAAVLALTPVAPARSKENTVLRGALNPSIVHVIPNAVVASQFRPAEPVPPVPDIRASSPLLLPHLSHKLRLKLRISRSQHRVHHAPRVPQGHRPSHRRAPQSLRPAPGRALPHRCVALSPLHSRSLLDRDADFARSASQEGTAPRSSSSTRCATSTRRCCATESTSSAPSSTSTFAACVLFLLIASSPEPER